MIPKSSTRATKKHRRVKTLSMLLPLMMILLISQAWNANAQTIEQERPNLLGIELAGRAGLYSLNYERVVLPRIGIGVGFASHTLVGGFFSYTKSTSNIVPLYVSWTPIGNKHSLYLSGGATVAITTRTRLTTNVTSHHGGAIGTATFGYQYRSTRGFLIRPTINTLFDRSEGILWPGLTLGFTF